MSSRHILWEYKTTDIEGSVVQGYIVDDPDNMRGCESCLNYMSVYAATWVQGERGYSPELPDTMVMFECLNCFFKYETKAITFARPADPDAEIFKDEPDEVSQIDLDGGRFGEV